MAHPAHSHASTVRGVEAGLVLDLTKKVIGDVFDSEQLSQVLLGLQYWLAWQLGQPVCW